MKICRRFIACFALAVMVLPAQSQGRGQRPGVVAPTHADVVYGAHVRNRLDLWLAPVEKATPLLICIHGGGFVGGDKKLYHKNRGLLKTMLDAGVSVAAINYRLTEGGKNPYPGPMLDGARAVQFLRFNARKYNLNKKRFAATGGSAGGMMLLWLGFHPDLAQPDHADPVLRESSRLQVLAPQNGPTSVHVPTLEKWFGVKSLVPHPAFRPLFGLAATGPLEVTEELVRAMHDASPITHLTAADPPAYLAHGPDKPVNEASKPGLWVHHPVMGKELKKAMTALGLECHLQYARGPRVKGYRSQIDFIVRKLTQP